jgi:Gti1/Pac2 family
MRLNDFIYKLLRARLPYFTAFYYSSLIRYNLAIIYFKTPPLIYKSESSSEKFTNTLQSTFIGHVFTINDAFVLFKACFNSHLNYIRRRPYYYKRNLLIRSGYIFIYEENMAGIKR